MDINGYIIEPKYIAPDGKTINWAISGSGQYVDGTKDGQLYRLKRDNNVLYPDEAKLRFFYKDPEMLRRAIEAKTAPFKALRDKQKAMMRLMEPLSYERDHIAMEVDCFRDYENHLVTAAYYVKGGVFRDSFDFTSLPKETFLEIAREMARDIEKIHSVKVIHSDIKLDNFVLVPKGGKYTPYLIDFDISFPAEKIPFNGEIGGSEGHISPEVLTYRSKKEDSLRSTITPAIDIFALACTFHYLWTYSLPKGSEGESVGEALLNGHSFSIDPKFDFEIGPKRKVRFSSLLKAMLSLDPASRPSAGKVAEIVEDKLALDGDYESESDKEIEEDKKIEKTDEEPKKPAETEVSIEKPWESDHISFVEKSKIQEFGIVKIARGIREGSYVLTRSSGLAMSYGASSLISMGVAIKEASEKETEGLWEEDASEGYYLDKAALAKNAIKAVGRVEIREKHMYRLTYVSHTTDTTAQVLKLMRILTK